MNKKDFYVVYDKYKNASIFDYEKDKEDFMVTDRDGYTVAYCLALNNKYFNPNNDLLFLKAPNNCTVVDVVLLTTLKLEKEFLRTYKDKKIDKDLLLDCMIKKEKKISSYYLSYNHNHGADEHSTLDDAKAYYLKNYKDDDIFICWEEDTDEDYNINYDCLIYHNDIQALFVDNICKKAILPREYMLEYDKLFKEGEYQDNLKIKEN